MLTIAIPTYNRNAILLENLRHLAPQMTPACRLLILDNSSDIPVGETLQPLWLQYPHLRYQVIRHPVNIGGNANMLRCFELCDTSWLWILGDDDLPKPEAIATIFRHIRIYPDCLFFNILPGGQARRNPILTVGLADFIRRLDSFSGILFLSADIYRVADVKKNLKIGYTYAYSTAPHLATLLMSLGDHGKCCLSGESIVDQGPPRPSADQWPLVYNLLGIMTLLDLPLSPILRRELSRQILKTLPRWESLVTQLVLTAMQGGGHQSAIYYYDQVVHRLYYYDQSILRRIRTAIYRTLIRFPRLGFRIITLAFQFSGRRPLSTDMLQDLLTRM